MPPPEPLRLVDDLESLGVVIYGVDAWYFVESGVVELPGGLATEGSNVSANAAAARDYISSELPDGIDLVSLAFEGYWLS